MIYWNIEQGTPDWELIRYGKIGGTLAKNLFTDTDTLMITLLSCRLEEYSQEYEGYENAAMIRGHELEPVARDRASKYLGIDYKQAGWIQSKHDIAGISPDGITEDGRIGIEIKCPGRVKHTKTILLDDIPLDNIHQCVHYFTVNDKLEELWFCSYRPESKRDLYLRSLKRISLVNLGTEKKPIIKPISEWVELANKRIEEIEKEIKQREGEIW